MTSGRLLAPGQDVDLAGDASGLPIEAAYRLADLHLRVTVAGRALAAVLLRAVAHLREEAPSGPADLTISIRDVSLVGAGGGASPPGDPGDAASPLEVLPVGRRLVRASPAGTQWLDLDAGRLVAWFASAAAVPATERAKPLARMLAAWLRDRGRQVVHTAMVADRDAGALLAGLNGAGKSTAALASALAGLAYAGDDLVAIEEADAGAFVGHSLYSSCLLDRSHLTRFPLLPPRAIDTLDPGRDKIVLQLAEGLPGGTARTAPVRALLLPRVRGAAVGTLRPASAPEALRALAPSSLFVHRGQGQAELARLARLVRAVPCWWLDLGGPLDEIPSLVRQALERATR